MTKISIFFILLAVSAAVGSKSTATQTTVHLPAPVFLLPANVRATGTPVASDPVCRAVWTTDGSLCSGQQLVAYQTQKTNALAQLVTKAALQVLKTSETASSLNQEMVMNHQILTRRRVLGATKNDTQLRLSKDLSLTLKEALTKLHPFQDEALIQSYKGQMTTCWSFLQKARNASLCYTCSKQNSKYFVNGKAIVSQEDCGVMLASCLPFFNTTATLVISADEFTSEASKKAKSGSSSGNNWQNNADLTNFVHKLSEEMKAAKITELLTTYNSLPASNPNKQKEGNKLCARLFRLHKDPLFGVIEKMTSVVNDGLKNLATPSANQPKVLALLDLMEHARSLQGLGNLDASGNPFEGDVVVLVPQDNMYVSFDGAQGSSLHFDSGPHVSMNLSLAFP